MGSQRVGHGWATFIHMPSSLPRESWEDTRPPLPKLGSSEHWRTPSACEFFRVVELLTNKFLPHQLEISLSFCLCLSRYCTINMPPSVDLTRQEQSVRSKPWTLAVCRMPCSHSRQTEGVCGFSSPLHAGPLLLPHFRCLSCRRASV